MGRAVGPGAGHRPLAPDRISVHHRRSHGGRHIGDRREDLLPVAAHLLATREPSGRMGRGLVAVVRREAAHQLLEVVGVRRVDEADDDALRCRVQVHEPSIRYRSPASNMTTIDPDAPAVKGPRTYRSPRRAEQARRTRDRVLDRAVQLFVAGGYGPTTMEAVATAAGVSVETVYKAFGTKAGLI